MAQPHNLRAKVKERISPKEPFGISLRLAAASAEHLVNDKKEREKLKKFLADNDMYLYTVNAFPYGPFKGTRVKEQVYEPDWRSEETHAVHDQCRRVLGDVAPEGSSPSIQSAPLGFKPRVTGPDVVASFTEHVLQVAARLVDIHARTGRMVGLSLEPEPSVSWKPPTKRLIISRITCIPAQPRHGLLNSPASQSQKRTSRCAVTSASYSTSAIRPSNTKTFRIAAEACRCRHSGIQTSGSGGAIHARSQRPCR